MRARFCISGQEVDLRHRAGAAHPDHGDSPADRERGQVLLEVGGAHELEDHVVRAALPEALGRNRASAEPLDLGALLLAPNGGADPRAGGAAELHRCGPNAAGGAVHEQVLPGTQAGLAEDRVVRGHEDLGQPSGLGPAEAIGHRHGRALVHDRQLRLAAAAHHGHHTVALGEARGARAQGGHLARELEPGDVLGRAGRSGIGAAPLEHVRAVDARAAHAHEQLAVPGLGVRALLDHELRVLDGDGAHRGESIRAWAGYALHCRRSRHHHRRPP